MDWNKLKAEYIAGGTSYRKLAEKYKDEGVTFDNLKNVAVKEGWAKLKEQAKDKATTKMVETIASDIANNSIKINDVADKLLDKISYMLDVDGVLDTQSIKHLASSLKDIKEIKGVKGELDPEKPFGVVLMPPIMPDIIPPSEEKEDG